ncbi:hypothetical protein [Natronolimnohabitans innermongolicus]|nr:hypothetical protein [Natronolimnohabitans innermongolicus]
MTNSTANSSGVGPFETRFQTGAAAVAALSALVALVFFWTGYQNVELVGTEMTLLSGSAGGMFAALVATVALVMALYMEPGFDH